MTKKPSLGLVTLEVGQDAHGQDEICQETPDGSATAAAGVLRQACAGLLSGARNGIPSGCMPVVC